jgi:hypothetical protein
MNATTVQFSFDASVPMAEVEATLRLALMAVESIHGEDRVRLEASFGIDRESRVCVIGSSTDAGRLLALVFGGFVRREFGEAAVRVAHLRVASLATGGGV